MPDLKDFESGGLRGLTHCAGNEFPAYALVTQTWKSRPRRLLVTLATSEDVIIIGKQTGSLPFRGLVDSTLPSSNPQRAGGPQRRGQESLKCNRCAIYFYSLRDAFGDLCFWSDSIGRDMELRRQNL